MRDHLVGALAAVVVLGLLLVALLWSASVPADEPLAVPPAPAAPSGDATPPADLGPDETWLGDVTLGSGTLVAADARLLDVRATGTDVVAGDDGLVAGTLDVRAVVPFDVVAARLGEGVVVGPAGEGEARVVRSTELLGRRLQVVATGTVEAVDGRIVVEPTSVDVGLPDALSRATGAAAARLVTIEQEVEGVPPGLVLRDVEVTARGFAVVLDGEGVRVVAP